MGCRVVIPESMHMDRCGPASSQVMRIVGAVALDQRSYVAAMEFRMEILGGRSDGGRDQNERRTKQAGGGASKKPLCVRYMQCKFTKLRQKRFS